MIPSKEEKHINFSFLLYIYVLESPYRHLELLIKSTTLRTLNFIGYFYFYLKLVHVEHREHWKNQTWLYDDMLPLLTQKTRLSLCVSSQSLLFQMAWQEHVPMSLSTVLSQHTIFIIALHTVIWGRNCDRVPNLNHSLSRTKDILHF